MTHGKPAATLLLASLTACSTLGPRPCPASQQPAVQDLLFFGAEQPAGRVTPEDWTRFLGEIVTPRFPRGLTAWQASGQWRSGSGEVVREPSYVLALIHPAGAGQDAAIREISAAYKQRFRQEAVLRVRSEVCVAF